MEHFVVSARKYRPQTFKDVVGQQAITNTLLNAIEHNHLAQALLFTGPRGVGKTTCARILAKKINEDSHKDPNEDFAFNIFELDAASNNSVDDIRNLIDQVRIPPQVGKYKVYIIDEVHMLSSAAFNAFLKTLEEPPKHAIFILATTEKHKIIPTILSRCQIFDFKRITVKDIKEYLKYIAEKENISAEDDALHIIAQKSDGAMRDALSIYDRVVSFSGKNLTRQAVTENLNVLDYETYIVATDLILQNQIPQLLLHFNEILSKGFDGQHFIAGLAGHFRDLLVCKDQKTIDLLEVGDNTKTLYFEQSQKTSFAFLLKAVDLANECDLQYRSSRNQRLLVELCLMQLASLTFEAEKKNDSRFIIPVSHFTKAPAPAPALEIPKEKRRVISNVEYAKGDAAPPDEAQIPASENNPTKTCLENEVKEPKPEKLEKPKQEPGIKKKVSGFSLKSVQKKKEIEALQRENQKEQEVEKSEIFTEEQMQDAWKEYLQLQDQKGEKILASIMGTSLPELQENKILLRLPNSTMKLDLERNQNALLFFLKEKLNNTSISLEIEVDETTEKKFAFTPREKYEKLKEKNPLIEKLRTTFDLDV